MHRLLYIVPLLLAGAHGKCIKNIKISSFTDTTISLSWDYSCDIDKVDIFKVDYKHLKYKACDDDKRDFKRPSGFGNIEVSVNQAVIENLHPYSDYSFEVRVITKDRSRRKPETVSITGSTHWSIPIAKAKISSLDYTFKNTAHTLWFNWSPPSPKTECSLYRSQLGSYVYIVRGVSDWNRDYVFEDSVKITESLVNVTGLQPYSHYIFMLYISNEAGEYDEDVYLKLEGRTLPTVPQPPNQLAANQLHQERSPSLYSVMCLNFEPLPNFVILGLRTLRC